MSTEMDPKDAVRLIEGIEERARKEERERYGSVVAAARFLVDHSAGHPSRPSAQRSAWNALERALAALSEALGKFGEHSPLCASRTREEPCNCGFREVFALTTPGIVEGMAEARSETAAALADKPTQEEATQ